MPFRVKSPKCIYGLVAKKTANKIAVSLAIIACPVPSGTGLEACASISFVMVK